MENFYCLKIIIEASKNIQPDTCPSSSPLLPGGEHRAFPSHLAAHTISQDPALGRLSARPLDHCALSRRLGRGPEVRWGWLALYTLHPARPSTYAVCELSVGKRASSLGMGPLRGKIKSQSPLTPPLPSPPAQGKLSSSSSAISLANSKSCCSRSRRSWGKRWGEGGPLRTSRSLSALPSPPQPQAGGCQSFTAAPALPETSHFLFL